MAPRRIGEAVPLQASPLASKGFAELRSGRSQFFEVSLREFRGLPLPPHLLRPDGTNRGRLAHQQGSRFAGLSPSPSQASSSTGPHRGTPVTQRAPPRSHRRWRPPQTRASRFAIQNPMPQPPAAAKKIPTIRAQGCGAAALAQPLRRVTRSDCRRRGLQGAQLQYDTTPTRQRNH
jgi:hypothetical protein